MSKKQKKKTEHRKPEERCHILSGKRGFIKVSYKPSDSDEQFSLVYGRCDRFAKDNCRILGYDTRHAHDPVEFGPCHRHYLGEKAKFYLSQYIEVYDTFYPQWQAIDKHFDTHDSLDNFILN